MEVYAWLITGLIFGAGGVLAARYLLRKRAQRDLQESMPYGKRRRSTPTD